MASERLSGDGLSGQTFVLSGKGGHVYSVAVSPDGLYVAAVFANGALSIMDSTNLVSVTRAMSGASCAELPSTSVRWFPQFAQNQYRLATVSSGGVLFLWEFNGQVVNCASTIEQTGNELATVDIDKPGNRVLTAGSDRVVRLYTADGELVAALCEGFRADGTRRTTHTNRVFSARFVTPGVAASAGWESPVQLWDTRAHCSHQQLFCTAASSDCLEPLPNTSLLLVAANESERPLQLFDVVGGVLRETESDHLSACLSKGERVIVTRVREGSDYVWCLTISPSTVVVLSLSASRVVGRIALPFVGMNITLHPSQPDRAYVAGQHDCLAVLSLASS